MKTQIAALIATSVIVFASPTFGQQARSATEKPEFRKWDVGGSLGIIGSPTDFSGRQQPRYTELGFIWNISDLRAHGFSRRALGNGA